MKQPLFSKYGPGTEFSLFYSRAAIRDFLEEVVAFDNVGLEGKRRYHRGRVQHR